MQGLTKKQRDIINYIQEFINANSYSPSYREIMAHFGFSSTGSVYKYINILKRKGLLNSEKKASRSLSIQNHLSKGGIDTELPFIGYISAGRPIEILSKMQIISVPESLVPSPENTYVLRVRDNTLAEEQMIDGDLLIVEARQTAQSGETVIALINHHDVLIKRYYRENDYVRLEGNSSVHNPIIIPSHDMTIQGVIIGLLRVYLTR